MLRQALLIGSALAASLPIWPGCVARLPAQNLAGQLRLRKYVATHDINGTPTSIANAGDGSNRLFFTTQEGRVWVVKGGTRLGVPFLDIRSRVSHGDERGLLSIVFHPEYADNGYFFVDYTDLQGNTVVSRFEVSDSPDVASPSSETFVIGIEQPYPRHNGGELQFGPDGYLYIGTGDGGSVGDPGNRAQNLGVLLGKILRIDVDGSSPYRIPSDNPFRFQAGAREEIWAYGLRNPWRFSFDRNTGDLFIGDVGQSAVEEINFQPSNSDGGENYGWHRMEGSQCYDPPEDCEDGTLRLPVIEYEHIGGGRSVTGGYVYRGSDYPQLDGVYFYADWVTEEMFLAKRSGASWMPIGTLDADLQINAFGEDEHGELYVADWHDADIYRIEADNPRPALSSTVPEMVMGGGPAFTLTLRGQGFSSLSAVLWDGSPRPTAFVSGTRLRVEVAESDIAEAGVAQIRVRNPSPGGGTSSAVTFTIEEPPRIIPEIFQGGVGNSAGVTTITGIAPGSIASVYGTNLSIETEPADVVPLPTSLGGGMLQMSPQDLALRFGGTVLVPQFFASPAQQNVQIPWELEGVQGATITAIPGEEQSTPVEVEIVPYNPGLFSTNSQGFGQGSIQIVGAGGILAAPVSPFSVARPAEKCEYVTIWATGLGPVTNTPLTGAAAPTDPLAHTTTLPEVTIGGVLAEVIFSGLAPPFVGLYQINAKVPENAPSGLAVGVVLTIGGIQSNVVTMAVQ